MRLTDVDALIDDIKDRYCKDCNRRKGIKKGKLRIIYEVGDAPCRACDVDDMLYELENAPTANVHGTNVGKWIYGESESGRDGYYCSQCGEHIGWRYGEEDIDFISSYNYCPKCGAQMEVEDVQESD